MKNFKVFLLGETFEKCRFGDIMTAVLLIVFIFISVFGFPIPQVLPRLWKKALNTLLRILFSIENLVLWARSEAIGSAGISPRKNPGVRIQNPE